MSRFQRVGLAAGATFLVAVLAGCGGGSSSATPDAGSGSATLTPAATTNTQITSALAGNSLVISEIGSNYYSDDIAWIELHNRTAEPIALAGYVLRTGYAVPSTGEISTVPTAFALPDVSVPAHGDLVVAGKVYDDLADSAQAVYVSSGSRVPYWNGSGSVELASGGNSVDFVRFGDSTAAPLAAGAWSGPNLAALPSGPTQHGRSVVRLAAGGYADTNTAADWALVNFATPAGPNDVPPGVVDSDGDGIPDSAKQAGATYAGMDLWSMGARPGRRDLFIEIDHMNGSDPALTPRREALQKLVDTFAAHNIALHLDTGNLYAPTFDPAAFNLGGGNAVDFSPCIELADGSANLAPGCTSFYVYKRANFDARRRLVFHYALFANSQNADGSAGSSGIAELPGNDLIVTLGGYGFNPKTTSGLNMLISLQASTLMHELGHNLGLHHGGNEDANYKPNQLSVMNYMYQFAGLTASPDNATAAERYYLANGLKGKTYCNLADNSPCGSDFVIGYSDGSGAPLDENSLSEAANIGHGSSGGAYADWDNNGALTGGTLARNITPLYDSARTVLRDYDEWDHLQLSFRGGYSGGNSGSSLLTDQTAAAVLAPRSAGPLSDVARNRQTEKALPPALQDTLRTLAAAAQQEETQQPEWCLPWKR